MPRARHDPHRPRLTRRFLGAALFLGWACGLLPATGRAQAIRDGRGWLGVHTEPVASLPELEETGGAAGATGGVRVTAVVPDSPADRGGLLAGDIIIAVCGEPFTCPAESLAALFRRRLARRDAGEPCPMRVIRDEVNREILLDGRAATASAAGIFWRRPEALLDSLRPGDSLFVRVEKRRVVLDLPIVLGLRPEARWPPPRENARIYPPGRHPPSDFAALFWSLARQHGIVADTRDLLRRLARTHAGSDPFRLEPMIYAHRDPLRAESVARETTGRLAESQTAADLLRGISSVWLPGHRSSMPQDRRLRVPKRTATLRGLLDQVTRILAEARIWHRRAFAGLTEEERRFLSRARWNLPEVFAENVYIHFDEDTARFSTNKRILDLARRVDYGSLLEAAQRLALLADPQWAREAAELLGEVFADSLDAPILLEKATPHGRILIGGTAPHWYRETDAAFIFDLGGDDVYSGNSGSGWETPLAVCIDMAGDDAYEATGRGSQGTGCLGAGGLLDVSGHDTYIGIQWCQGTGYLGIGWLHDLAGHDTYRGRTFCQGVGLFGAGFILDAEGDDRYEGDGHVQAVGLAGGIGALVDARGDDAYYAKGLYPTGYGDPGIFDAWSQGCGQGFRTLASGGLGALVDGGGADRMEAGNFSQGGGYYYGFGILQARGAGDDVYIGSRYNQGFSAHQAVGVFLEEGGNDRYATRQGVAQGLAWDECVTLFIDGSGDDHYDGGGFFSLGASAHNSICIFVERAGRDTYLYPPGLARAGGNTYHGGTSYSLFLDEAGLDLYEAAEADNDRTLYAPEHGLFIDRDEGEPRPATMRRPVRSATR